MICTNQNKENAHSNIKNYKDQVNSIKQWHIKPSLQSVLTIKTFNNEYSVELLKRLL